MSRLSRFITNTDALVSTGTVTINIDTGTPLEIPITSKGVLELREQLVAFRPTAPKKALVIKADSDIGKELGIEEDQVKLVQDEADAGYLSKLEAYSLDFVWHLAIQGIDMDFFDKKDNKITDFEGKKATLILNGITIEQLEIIFAAILKLGEAKAVELDAYIRQSVGISKAITRKIVARSKKGKGTPVGKIYNETRVMQDYDLSPSDWDELTDVDRKVLNYSLLMKYHIEAEQIETQERAQKLEANKQKVMGSLPTFSR